MILSLQRTFKKTLVFNISKTYEKDISKQPQFFAFQSYIKICAQVTSVFHLSCTINTPKQCRFFVHGNQVEKITSKRHWSFVYRNYAKQSMSKRRRFFADRNYRKKVRWSDVDFLPIEITSKKWRGNLSIFSFWRIDIISTSNRRRFDVLSVT